MRNILSVAGTMLVAGAMPLFAQGTVSPRCQTSAGVPAEAVDACQKGIDIFNYMAPQLATTIVGGNPTLGQGGTLGGLRHFTVALRGNIIQGSLPQVEEVGFSTGGTAVSDTYETRSQVFGLPAVEAAIGLFAGIPLPPLTRIGGVDLLLSGAYLPEFNGDEVAVNGGGLKIGYGVRLGLLQESLTLPGVGFTWMRRDLPEVDIITSTPSGFGLTGQNDTLALNGLALETTSWRITAAKNFLVFGLAAGIGQDSYKSRAEVDVVVNEPGPCTTGCRGSAMRFDQDVSRTNMFLNAYFNIMLAKLVAEVGQVSGGDIETFNQFNGKAADDSRLFGSLGLRIGF